jgi:two-component system, chemotaxis family, response regulator Rcp1
MTAERRILLVEDNAGDVRLTREALREAEVAVDLVAVPDGDQALEFLRGEGARPDLILLDLNLPRRDGREVLEIVKQDPELRLIPIIVLTTSNAPHDINACYERHANCYIVKPLELDAFSELMATIRSFWMGVVRLP